MVPWCGGPRRLGRITSPANRSFFRQNYSPFLFLYFDGVAGAVVSKFLLCFREVLFEIR